MEPDPRPPDPRTVALGHRIRRLRKRAGLTQEHVADRMQVHVNTVGAWERAVAEMRAVDAPKLASVLGVSVDVLLGSRGEHAGLALARSGIAFFVRRAAVQRILDAKRIEDLRDLFDAGIRVGHEVAADAEEVSAEEWGRIITVVDAKLASLGEIPEDW